MSAKTEAGAKMKDDRLILVVVVMLLFAYILQSMEIRALEEQVQVYMDLVDMYFKG